MALALNEWFWIGGFAALAAFCSGAIYGFWGAVGAAGAAVAHGYLAVSAYHTFLQ